MCERVGIPTNDTMTAKVMAENLIEHADDVSTGIQAAQMTKVPGQGIVATKGKKLVGKHPISGKEVYK